MSDLNSELGNRGLFDSKGWILYAENKETEHAWIYQLWNPTLTEIRSCSLQSKRV